MRIGRVEFKGGGVTWLGRNTVNGGLYDLYWLYLFNWLDPDRRYWGREWMYYDGPHPSIGLWFFNISWRSPWTPWTVEAPWESPAAGVE